jgi:DNA replicative helicase MCM subunit Mcm2 (Cdc46/Mcm family)
MRVVGLKVEGAGRLTSKFTPEEENEMIRISRRPQLYKELTESIAPAIYGHTGLHHCLRTHN